MHWKNTKMKRKEKLKYLIRSILTAGSKRECPFCGSTEVNVVDRKYMVTSLLACENCHLMHRHPKDDESWLRNFYQETYDIDTHRMTDLPNDDELADILAGNFDGFRDYELYLNPLLEKGARILDYGCSWGYNVALLNSNGFLAEGYELSAPRARFGRDKMGLRIYSKVEDLVGKYDLIFSSHVIEHLSDIKSFLSLSRNLLKEDGYLMLFCPNGNNQYRARERKEWHVNWGLVHPNYISTDFAQYVFLNNPYLIMTGDWTYESSMIGRWDRSTQEVAPQADGKELMILVRPNIIIG